MHAGEFDDILNRNSSNSTDGSEPEEEIRITYSDVRGSLELGSNGSLPKDKYSILLNIENLTVQTPGSKATLIRDLSLVINQKEHLLVSKPICNVS